MALKSNGVTQVPDGLGTPGQVLKVNSGGTAGEWGSIATSDNSKLPLAGGTMSGDVLYNDDIKAKFGTDSDLQVYHDGTNGYLKNDTGNFQIFGDQGNAAINVASGYGNSVSLEYANSTKLQTSSTGVYMAYGASFGGDVISSNFVNGTSGQKYFQAKNEFFAGLTDGSIFGGMSFYNSKSGTTTGITGYMRGVANGTSGNMNLEIITGTAGSLTQKVLIKDAGVDITGDLQLNSTKKIMFDDFRQYIKGTASLFGTNVTMEIGTGGTPTISATHAGNVGIGTTSPSTKLDVAGDITVSGTVDGRDVATDGTKLDGIEAGATADQTTIAVSTAGSNVYKFTGDGFPVESGDNPNMYFDRGQTYVINNSQHASHPLDIRLSDGGAAYTSGVSGASGAKVTFTVPMDAPDKLVYQCTSHAAMVGNIYITGKGINGYAVEVVSSLPSSPDSNTIYFVTG
jgi:hypothetical protein